MYPRKTVAITQRNASGEENIHAVQLPDEVYCGELDVTSGLLTVTHKMFSLPVSEMNNSDAYPGWSNTESLDGLDECLPPTNDGQVKGFTSNIAIDNPNQGRKFSYVLNDTTKLVLVNKNLYGTQSQIQANYPNLVIQILLPLIDPYTVNVTPQEIHALDGKNTFLSDEGTVEVSGVVNAGVHAVSPWSFSPPVLNLTGDASDMTKDNAVDLAYEYQGMVGTASVKWQGSSSIKYPKKNYTIKFDVPFVAKEGWSAQKKYCLKANYIDFSHSRNVVCAKLWGQVVATRQNVNTTLAASPNYGAVDGFPVTVVLNGEYMGVYTFNIPKDGWMANMGSGAKECIVCADGNNDVCAFKAAGAVLDKDFSLEYITDENSTAWAQTGINNLITACINSDGSDLDTTIAGMLDWESAIDYWIFVALLRGDDMMTKNYLLDTYDGTKWIFGAYDMDAVFGLHWNGETFLPATSGCTFADLAATHKIPELIIAHKKDALKTRYTALRAGVMSEDNVATTFRNFAGQLPMLLLDEDNRVWPTIPNTNCNNVQQILDWYRLRCAMLDAEVDAM